MSSNGVLQGLLCLHNQVNVLVRRRSEVRQKQKASLEPAYWSSHIQFKASRYLFCCICSGVSSDPVVYYWYQQLQIILFDSFYLI